MAEFLKPIWEPIHLHQYAYPDNIPEQDRTTILDEQKDQLTEKIIELRKTQLRYLSSHPEIRAILKEFLYHLWNFMPPSNLLPRTCREFFGQCKYELQSKINKHLSKIYDCKEPESSHTIINEKCSDTDHIVIPDWFWSSESDSEYDMGNQQVDTFVNYEKHIKRQNRSIWKKPHFFPPNSAHSTRSSQRRFSTVSQLGKVSNLSRMQSYKDIHSSSTTLKSTNDDNPFKTSFADFLNFDL